MLREYVLTSQLIKTLQEGGITKIIRSRRGKNIEMRREVGNNSFIADILISSFPQKMVQNDFNTKQTKFIAIEVKISDWKQGLYQAWRYCSFAEKSYLALYKDYAKNADISLFKKHNVGLIVFDENTIKVLHHPTSNNFSSNKVYEVNLREKIWRRSLSIQSIQPAI
ncbi:MAG: hypothetical protein WC473_01380 [Patescibacteria group bacterium]|jgi:hypothetical protein